MDKDIINQYKGQQDLGITCEQWLNSETTQKFLQPLKDKLAKLKDINFDDIVAMEDKSFRSKVEAHFLAAKEIEDYFGILEAMILGASEANSALEGKNIDEY